MDSKPNNKNNVPKNKDIDINVKGDSENIDLNIEDLEIEDLSFDLNITPNSGSETTVNTSDSASDSKGKDLGTKESVGTDSNLPDATEQGIQNDIGSNDSFDSSSMENVDTGSSNVNDSDTDMTDIADNQNNYDDRSLKEKAEDLKEDLKQTKEKIQNLPEDIKNKKEDIQQKAKKAKEDIKNLPENARKKAEDVKDRAKQAKENIQNFPKSKEELGSAVKDRLKKSAKRAKEKAQDTANKALEKGKENLKDRLENSKPVKAAKKAKKAYDNTKKAINRTKKAAKATKKAVKVAAKATKAAAKVAVKATKGLIDLIVATFPWSLIVIGVVLLVALVIIIAVAVVPGKDDIKDSYQSENYSETDLNTLEKLRNLYEKYPGADTALAMVTVIYPYYETLQDGNVTYYLNTSNKNWDPSKTYKDYEDIPDYKDADEEEDKKSCEGDDCDTEVGDDMYLELFRKWSYRRKFKLLLKESKSKTEDEFTDYLKKEYFTSESGYKSLFDYVDKDKQEDFADAIIEDLKEKRNYFINYLYENKTCVSQLNSAGTVEVEEMLKGNLLVDVKVSSCTTGKNVWDCESMYDAPITMEKYVKGVTYEEIGVSGSSDVEKVKAQMVAAKSYVIGRSKSMGWGTKQDSAGNYVVTIRANTNDQDYCDIDVGCSSGKTEVRSGSRKRPAVDEETRAKLDEAWAATQSVYVYSSKSKTTAGEFCNSRSGVCDFCHKGTCLAHQELSNYKGTDYASILADQYSSYELLTIENGIANVSVPSGLDCYGSNNDGTCGLPDDLYKYYSQRDYKTQFCGRTNATISSSGCGVTSMAMVISNLTDQTVTPEDTMKEAYEGGYCGAGIDGTSSGYFSVAAKKYGLTYKQLSVDKKGAEEAAQILRNGGLIIANVNDLSPFTTGGHYIVIRKIDEDGKVYVGDPNHKELYNKRYDLSSFINGWISSGHAWFAFTSEKSKDIVNKYCTTTSAANTNGKFAVNNRKNGQHSGQCIVYVESRAVEIINSAQVGYDDINDRGKYTKIWSEEGFGGAKCALKDARVCSDHSKPSRMKKLFKTSSDYTKPQAGAVIVWDHGKSNEYGHIAVIEEVKDNGSVVVSQSNWCTGSCEQYSLDTLTMDQVKNYGDHAFIGYIYLLQPIK